MFKQLLNIDSAFKHVRLFSIAFLLAMVIVCCFIDYNASQVLKRGQQRIYILLNGKLLDAMAIDRADSLSVEISDHVKMFHYYFYSLEPDEAIIKKHITNALYLADNSAKQEYDNLTESQYYSNIISGNVSQQMEDPDSIQVNLNVIPYTFRYYGKLRIVRSTSITTRSLVSEGIIRVLKSVDPKNPHGFLIEHWKILDNKDLTIQKR